MNEIWLQLEEFIKYMMLKDKEFISLYLGFAIIRDKMEQLKSEYVYQSLKEAGYF